MTKIGVFATASGLIIAVAPAVLASEVVDVSGLEAQLRYDALRRGIILTEEALDAYRASMPDRLGTAGPLSGGVLGGLVANSIARRANNPGTIAGVEVRPDAGEPNLEEPSRATVRASVIGFLDALANIRVRVRPAPPRDYAVMINGRAYPASDRSIYAIPPGTVQVSVSRKGKPPCHWIGTVNTEVDKILDCRL
jgi:hypothetical protein